MVSGHFLEGCVILQTDERWAVSSEEERLLHEQEVAGSSPAPPTIIYHYGTEPRYIKVVFQDQEGQVPLLEPALRE